MSSSPLEKIPFLSRILHFSCRTLHEIFINATISSAFEETLIDFEVGKHIFENSFLKKGKNISNVLQLIVNGTKQLSLTEEEISKQLEEARAEGVTSKCEPLSLLLTVTGIFKIVRQEEKYHWLLPATRGKEEEISVEEEEEQDQKSKRKDEEQNANNNDDDNDRDNVNSGDYFHMSAELKSFLSQPIPNPPSNWTEEQQSSLVSLRKMFHVSHYSNINVELKLLLLKSCVHDLPRIFSTLVFKWNIIDDTREGFLGAMDYVNSDVNSNHRQKLRESGKKAQEIGFRCTGKVLYPRAVLEFSESQLVLTNGLCLALRRGSKKILNEFYFEPSSLLYSSSICWNHGTCDLLRPEAYRPNYELNTDGNNNKISLLNEFVGDVWEWNSDGWEISDSCRISNHSVPFFAAVLSGDKEIIRKMLELKRDENKNKNKNLNDIGSDEFMIDPYSPNRDEAYGNSYSSVLSVLIRNCASSRNVTRYEKENEKAKKTYDLIQFLIAKKEDGGCGLDLYRFCPLIDKSNGSVVTDPELIRKYREGVLARVGDQNEKNDDSTTSTRFNFMQASAESPLYLILQHIGTVEQDYFLDQGTKAPINNSKGDQRDWEWRVKFVQLFMENGLMPFWELRNLRRNFPDSAILPRTFWIPDEVSENCHRCNTFFGTVFGRKSHCERCGDLVCTVCLKDVLPKSKQGNFVKELLATKMTVCNYCQVEIQNCVN